MPQRIIFPKRGEVELQSFDLPEVGPGDLRIKTLYSLMSIGTETTILEQRYDPGTHFDRMFSFPQLQTGVQAVGRVDGCGDAVSEYQVGDLVYMRMAHGSHQVQLADECSPVPADTDLRQACWCGLAKTAFRAAWAGEFDSCESLLIAGAGPVGQMLVRWAGIANIAEVWVSDLSQFRLELADKGGATRVLRGDLSSRLDAIAEMRSGNGPALVVDTTGNPDVFATLLSAVARFGKVILLGDTGYPARQCLTSDVMTRGLTVQAVHDSHDRDGWTQRRVDAHFFEQVGKGRFPLDGLITHEFAPAKCREAYDVALNEREKAVGILYDWRGVE